MPHFIFKPIHIDESENSENQRWKSSLLVKEDKRYAAGQSTVFHSAQKKKRGIFIFGIMKIISDFSNREGEEKNAYKSN
jgi:hypothetical protein